MQLSMRTTYSTSGIVTFAISAFILQGCHKPATPAGDSGIPADQNTHIAADPAISQELYLDLMQRTLTDLVYENDPKGREERLDGRDWPGRAHTMIGLKRLENLRFCVEDVLRRDVPGDLIEAGAWRGGATIYMRAILKAHAITDRTVWVADSFEGLPPPDPENFPLDANSKLHTRDELAISLETVKSNFERYDLLDDRVKFLKGWFKDTLPEAPIDQLAVLRVDADMYESTMDALESLYPKLSPGGYCIIDDYVFFGPCRKAVHDYREKYGITEEIIVIDWSGVYWRKASEPRPVVPSAEESSSAEGP